MLPEMGGLEVLEELQEVDPDLVVLMITAFASVETAHHGHEEGRLRLRHQALQARRGPAHPAATASTSAACRTRTASCARALRDQARFTEIVGKSPRMQQVFGLITQAAPQRSTILVVGESGTGKELVAKAIHANSPRADKPFIVVNSGSLPHDLLESQPLRPREGRLHRRGLRQEGPVRAGGQGHALLRRDRQHPAGDPGQAAARDAGARVHAPGRRRDLSRWTCASWPPPTSTCAARWRRAASARTSTTGSTSSPSSSRPCASARRTSPRSSPTSWRSTRARTTSRCAGVTPGGAAGAHGLRLAGQRARAGERDRARASCSPPAPGSAAS